MRWTCCLYSQSRSNFMHWFWWVKEQASKSTFRVECDVLQPYRRIDSTSMRAKLYVQKVSFHCTTACFQRAYAAYNPALMELGIITTLRRTFSLTQQENISITRQGTLRPVPEDTINRSRYSEQNETIRYLWCWVLDIMSKFWSKDSLYGLFIGWRHLAMVHFLEEYLSPVFASLSDSTIWARFIIWPGQVLQSNQAWFSLEGLNKVSTATNSNVNVQNFGRFWSTNAAVPSAKSVFISLALRTSTLPMLVLNKVSTAELRA